MSIAKTFEVIADAVYEKGKVDGGGVDLSKCKYIEKSAVGKVISLTDVSEVAHKVKVYGDGQEVEVYGKNLCDYRQAKARNTTTFVTINDDESVTYDGNYYFIIPVTLPRGATCTVSFESPRGTNTKWSFVYDDNTETTNAFSGASFVTSTEKEVAKLYIYPDILVANPVKTTTIKNIQIALDSGKPYEPYTHQTITATPTGTEIDSMCPNMNFFADEDITVDYYSSFGMQTEYDGFWYVYQNKGNRTDYGSAFQSWEGTIFKPKYDITPVGGCGSLFLKSQISDIRKSLKDCGVILDTSRATSLSYLVHNSTTKSLPKVDASLCASSSSLQGSFHSAKNLEIIEEIVCSENTLFRTDTFQNCTPLTHVIFSGIIASDINLQWSPLLDDESLISLGESLVECDDGVYEAYSKTVTLSDELKVRLNEIYVDRPDKNEWDEETQIPITLYELIDTWLGWNIA